MTTTPTVTAEDCGDPAVRSFVLVSGPAWGIQLPNGTLYREPHAQIQDPHSTQPTVWFRQGAAQDQATAIAVMLDAWYGIEPSAPNELRVVALEMDTDGFWKLPPPVADQIGYRPLDLDTELVSAWPCASLAQLTGLPADIVATWLARSRFGATPVTPEIVANQQRVADLFYEQKLIPKQVNIASRVWTWQPRTGVRPD